MAPEAGAADNVPHWAKHDQVPTPGIGLLNMPAPRIQIVRPDCSVRQVDPAAEALSFRNKVRMDFLRNREIAAKLTEWLVDWRQQRQ
jgi:hypothetical protein